MPLHPGAKPNNNTKVHGILKRTYVDVEESQVRQNTIDFELASVQIYLVLSIRRDEVLADALRNVHDVSAKIKDIAIGFQYDQRSSLSCLALQPRRLRLISQQRSPMCYRYLHVTCVETYFN